MIQFNLLPDVKKEYIRAKRTKQIIVTVATIATGASIAVTLVLFSVVQFGQKKHIEDLTTDIQGAVADINQVGDIDKILTVQNQLLNLEAIHSEKPETSRLFDYLAQVTPAQVTFSEVSLDFAASSMRITGEADSFTTVNKFADTLKFVTYVSTDADGNKSESTTAFPTVLTQQNRDNEKATFTLDIVIDPTIFNNRYDVVLTVPDTITTRSVQNAPEIFNGQGSGN